MFIYMVLFFILLIGQKFIKKDKFNITDFFLISMLILIAGLREGIGTDYNMYKSFYFYPNQVSAQKVEWGFIQLIKISLCIFNEKYYLFFLICSTSTIIPIYLIMKRESKYPAFSLLLFVCLGFYTLSFNMIRQCIAIAISIYALKYIEKNKKFTYIALIVIASIFHITALAMIPVCFVGKLNFDKKTLKKIYLLLLFTGFLFNPLFKFVVNNISQYKMYATYDNIDAGIGTYLVDFIYLVMIGFTIWKKDRMVKNEFEMICLNVAILGVPMIVFSIKNILFARMIYYFFIPILMPFSNILDFFKIKNTQNVFDFVLIVLLLILFILNIISFNGVYPYQSIL